MIQLTDAITNDLSSDVTNLEYLVVIYTDPVIYISSRKQMFDSPAEGFVYYEDINIKISNIKEKIDLKTKKIQLSNVTLTLSNYPINGMRLSDNLTQALGKTISIYLKSQSCEDIDDCVLIAGLRITRLNHDDTKVSINADDFNLESFYIDLPKEESVLKSEVNTFEHYNDKPIPILYGHLTTAPTVVYVNNMASSNEFYNPNQYFKDNNVWIVPNDFNSNIRGIKYFDNSSDNRLIDNNSLQIKVGQSISDVPCLPYQSDYLILTTQ